MKLFAELSLFCCLLVAKVEGKFSSLYPEEREVLYKYEAVVTTGTEFPAPFVSRFNLTGNIKMQGLKEQATLQLINLKYSMYSGEEKRSKVAETVDLPKEAALLSEPFGIEYRDGKISALELSSEEATWSRSVKQALAGLLQLDLHSIDEQRAFKSTEKSIYGECLVSYTVIPQENGTKITKFQSGLDCSREGIVWSNIENVDCPSFKTHQDDLISTSEKVYHLMTFDEDSLLIQKVLSEGQTFIFTNPNSGHTHSITVSQKLELQSVSESFETLEIKNSTKIQSLEFNSSEYYSFKFSTNEDLEGIVKKVFQLLTVIVLQLQGPHQLRPQANTQQVQLIPLLITYLRKLNSSYLEHIFVELENKNISSQMDIFTSILPLVGSKDSSVAIVKLIKSKKLGTQVALYLLSSLPFNIRQTSEEILHELEDLLNLPEQISSSVRNTAILSFATLIYRTCGSENCNPKVLEKYVLKFSNSIKDCNHDYATQLAYITGLQNIRSQGAVALLEPLIVGKSKNLREAALRALSPLFTKQPVMAYEVFWPVLSDRSQISQVRAVALMALLEGEVNDSTFLQLHQFMDSEACPHLYNLYYSLLKRYAEDSYKCNPKKSESAGQTLRITRKPINSSISSSQIKFNLFREEVLLTIIGNPKTNNIDLFYISFTSTLTGYSRNYYSVFVKLQGVNARSLKDIVNIFTSPSKVQTLVSPKDKTSNLNSEPLHIELIVFNQGQAVATRFYNESNINSLFAETGTIITLKNNTDFSYQQISTSYSLEKYFVTDIGMPGVFSVDNPFISSFQGKVNIESSNLNSSISTRQWSQGTRVLKVKNSIVDIWQGIMKSHISRHNLPFGFQLKLDNNQGNVSFITSDVSDDASIGFKWYTTADLFTVTYSDSYDALSQSCQSCKTTSTVANQKTTNDALRDNSFDSFTVSSSIYDCENDGSKEEVKLAHDFYTGNTFSALGVIASSGNDLDNFLSNRTISGSCGYAALFIPRNARQKSRICINLTGTQKDEYSVKNTARQHLDDIQNQCDFEEKEGRCVIPRNYFPKCSNKNFKAEVPFVQVAESMVVALQKLCGTLKGNLLQNSSSSEKSPNLLLDVIKSKFSIVFSAENNSYSLNLINSPSAIFSLNSIPSGINPDLISFLNKVINPFVITSDNKLN